MSRRTEIKAESIDRICTLHICDGGKGGVGKSAVAIQLIEYFSYDPNNNVLVIEVDSQNPDVARSVLKSERNNITSMLVDLRTRDGWIDMIEHLEANYASFDHAIMSLPAADLNISQYVDLVGTVTKGLRIELNLYWLINRQPDSINLFDKSMASGFGSIANKVCVVINTIFGDRERFDRWMESNVRAKYVPNELVLRELHYKAMDAYALSGKTLGEFAAEGFISRRVQVEQYYKDFSRQLDAFLSSHRKDG